ncbi:uncharacterized protein LOC113518442 [Galleria mellonella]|uniref:Uncharacterized protein LOC113518442 n=1 Tax=Galleria mellonella TaxID=7137 RepID=A0A6J1WTT8_GALME|nr:uncharacterized protein LOC113518442 [Galleria mellonella]
MKHLIFLIFLAQYVYGKETVYYAAKGGDLFDLIRGIPPKNGALELSKVDKNTQDTLPDGIYYIPPEDEVFASEPHLLTLDVNAKKPVDNDKKPVSTADEHNNHDS